MPRLSAAERSRRYRLAHPGRNAEQKRRYRERHPGRILADRVARADHQREASKRSYRKNRDKVLARSRATYALNREAIQNRQYDATHREMKRAAWKRWFAAKRGGGGGALSAAEWADILRLFEYRCAYCGADDRPLEQDHVLPLSRGGKHEAANVVPACRSCNARKHTKTPEEWLAAA